jgi:NAD(P)-dependent dehydrogenase (short-subunit alcohol dehydrogenase family)
LGKTETFPAKDDFTNRRILITGAAGSIGRATAKLLAARGAKLILNGRDAARLHAIAATLPPESCSIAPFDLTNGEGMVAWMRGLCEKDGAFSGIAHTAGIQAMRPLRGISASFINETLVANVASGIMLGKAFRQKICHTEGASFVLVSSTAAFIGGGANVAYAASKGGVMAASKALAHELRRDTIRVNCVVPGLVESDLAAHAREITPPESWKTVLSGYPMGIGTAEDIAAAIIYLLSDAAQWVTGTELQIDGGLSIV